MSSLSILCPNAKRVQIKVAPMMLLQQVLEEACLKSGFDASAHRLQTQSKKPIDHSLPFRLSGIPNNATLEMVARPVSNAPVEIELAIQIPSGQRRQMKVGVNESLLEILRKFSTLFGEDLTSSIESTAPAVVYMNKRYTGNIELTNNTLSSLGITNGKCLMRYLRVEVSDEQLAEIEARNREEIEKKKALDATFAKLKAENEAREALERQRQLEFERDAEERAKRDQEHLKAILPEPEQMDTNEHESRDVLQDVPVQNPNDWSFNAPVFSRRAPTTAMRLDELNRLLERVDNSLGPSTTTNEDAMDSMVNALADGGRISLSEIRARAELEKQQRRDEAEKAENAFAEACERNPRIFSKVAKPATEQLEPMEISDEFFEVKMEDIKVIQKDLRKTVREQTQAGFVSKSFLAKKNRGLKMEAYKHCVIRIVIGMHVLQASFNSAEPSTRLDEFMAGVISDEATRKKMKFFLGNQHIKTCATKNFVDIELAPKSTIVARFHGEELNALNLIKGVKECEIAEADAISAEWLSVNTVYQPFNFMIDNDRIQKRPPTNYASTSTSFNEPPAKSSMPKWMIKGKK
ncbi:unnamed protein product [Caenorhabditis bovis]|uniref:TUG ubiquitin-like domain-containing protein n=1 Tax=Caenorhabditis bovis TaxID=2654633 RepID=A0A8S1EL75_9PELO|nr:unnamed protein product [Caenorhabditis bovis]